MDQMFKQLEALVTKGKHVEHNHNTRPFSKLYSPVSDSNSVSDHTIEPKKQRASKYQKTKYGEYETTCKEFLRPFYKNRKITTAQYKNILKKTVIAFHGNPKSFSRTNCKRQVKHYCYKYDRYNKQKQLKQNNIKTSREKSENDENDKSKEMYTLLSIPESKTTSKT